MNIKTETLPVESKFKPFAVTIEVMTHKEASMLLGLSATNYEDIRGLVGRVDRVDSYPVTDNITYDDARNVLFPLYEALGNALVQAVK